MKFRQWVNDHSLSVFIASLFLVSLVLQFLFQIPVVYNEAKAHGDTFAWSEFWPSFFKDLFENWQSEFLQVFVFVVATKYFIERNSAESTDSDDEIMERLDRLEEKIDAVSQR